MGRTQKQLADAIARELDIPIRAGRKFVARFIDLVAEDLVTTGRVELRGLGTFATIVRPARKTTHPKTGKRIRIGASNSVRYRTSVQLKRLLNPPKARKST